MCNIAAGSGASNLCSLNIGCRVVCFVKVLKAHFSSHFVGANSATRFGGGVGSSCRWLCTLLSAAKIPGILGEGEVKVEKL